MYLKFITKGVLQPDFAILLAIIVLLCQRLELSQKILIFDYSNTMFFLIFVIIPDQDIVFALWYMGLSRIFISTAHQEWVLMISPVSIKFLR